MIVVTGAAGKTGRAVIRALVGRGATVRALVHRPEQESPARRLGAQEVVSGDMRDPAILDRAMRGAAAVYHICPNMHPDEVGIGQGAIAAARKAGVQRLVYHSVLHPQVEAMPHHWLKMRVEEQIFASGLDYTILQPAAYMQNVLAYRESIVQHGLYSVPYAVDTRLGMVDLEDVAEVAAKVLSESGHGGATYELCGPEALTQTEVANLMGQQLGRAVQAQAVPLEAWREQAQAAGLGEYQVETLVKMFEYYERHGFRGNPTVPACLLGRRPTGFVDFLARVMPDWLHPRRNGTG
jgi:NAD(P)H dehydrogenase (quinone)